MKLKGFKIAETIRLTLARGFAGGIVWMIIFLIASPGDMPLYMKLLYPIFVPLFCLALLPVFIILDTIKLGWIPGLLTLLMSLPGDPILSSLRTKYPYWIPVEKYNFLVFNSYIFVYDDLLPQEKKEQNNSTDSTQIYNSSFGGRIIGRLESNGMIFTSSFGGSCIGRVEGKFVYNACNNGSIIARVEDNGNVFTSNFGGTLLGTIDSNGGIHSSGLIESGEIIARAEGTNIYGAGAAYLALLKNK